MSKQSFIYKYQPKKIDDFQMENATIDMIHKLIKICNINILFIGNQGSGKTSIIKSILLEYYGNIDDDLVLFINNLNEQGIQYYRNEVKIFCQTKSIKKKTVVIDDIDMINEQSQQVFRNFIDKYSSSVNFLCSCSNTQKVHESIQSRLNCIKINPLSNKQMDNILRHIILKENINMSPESIDFIIKISQQSSLTMINYLEKLKLLNKEISLDLCKNICIDIGFFKFEQYTEFCLKNQLNESILFMYHLTNKGFSVMDILDGYFKYIKYIDTIDDKIKYEITKLIMKYITIFYSIHENEIELAFFTNELINIFTPLNI